MLDNVLGFIVGLAPWCELVSVVRAVLKPTEAPLSLWASMACMFPHYCSANRIIAKATASYYKPHTIS